MMWMVIEKISDKSTRNETKLRTIVPRFNSGFGTWSSLFDYPWEAE